MFCIGAADGKGHPSTFNPPFAKIEKYSVLGEAVLASDIWRPSPDDRNAVHPGCHTTTSRRSGTSTATSIAAGVTSLLLECIRQCDDSGNGSETTKIIRKLFLAMSRPSATLPYRNIAPMLLFDPRNSEVMSDIRKILQKPPSTNPSKLIVNCQNRHRKLLVQRQKAKSSSMDPSATANIET